MNSLNIKETNNSSPQKLLRLLEKKLLQFVEICDVLKYADAKNIGEMEYREPCIW